MRLIFSSLCTLSALGPAVCPWPLSPNKNDPKSEPAVKLSIWCDTFIPFSWALHSECLLVAINWICVFWFFLVDLVWRYTFKQLSLFLWRFSHPNFHQPVLCFCLLLGLTCTFTCWCFSDNCHLLQSKWARCALEKNAAHLFSLLSIWLHK